MADQDGILSIADARRAGEGDAPQIESELWARLAHAADAASFSAQWLDIQCRLLDGVVRGVVVLRTTEAANFAPVALWPQGIEGHPKLAAVVESALTSRHVAVHGAKRGMRRQDPVFIAHPILVDDELYGAAALEVEGRSEAALKDLVQRLGWGVGWLEALARRKTFTSKARLVTVLELIATSLQHERFQAAATAVATELATTLGCERASIGFLKGRHIILRALSHSAAFSKKTNLVRALEAAMDEAADQLATIVYPPRKGGPFQVTRAHAALLQQHGAAAACTIPLTAGGEVLGALVLERPAGEEFDARTVELCEHAALLVGPVLDVKRREDRWLGAKALDSLRTHVRHLTGPRHAALKVWTSVAAAVLLFLVFAKGDYQVTADAALEGTVQRAIAAAIPGYIAEARARAGDLVRQGDVLATIDDRDLRLERLKWVSQRAQRSSEYREALASHQRARVQVLSAQLEQAEAQLALIDEQLARTKLVAPFDAIVVKGDLSQSLGAPVERGNVLFELAPLDAYRVIMKVDERDITTVEVGQPGHLALSSMPHDPLPLRVEKITPVSVVEEGRNYFRVEASAQGGVERLRPGMEGVGKIQIERRRLAWIWTHKIGHWLRMWVWSWWP
ncbi:MAG TPA: HlyD family efflux transporter periplasmic adaptor subunit [Burkholderiales bacterium]|nr:HlyD family efflux transporter periplasmic adaptor subunit [Burkholderiales bacterium]